MYVYLYSLILSVWLSLHIYMLKCFRCFKLLMMWKNPYKFIRSVNTSAKLITSAHLIIIQNIFPAVDLLQPRASHVIFRVTCVHRISGRDSDFDECHSANLPVHPTGIKRQDEGLYAIHLYCVIEGKGREPCVLQYVVVQLNLERKWPARRLIKFLKKCK